MIYRSGHLPKNNEKEEVSPLTKIFNFASGKSYQKHYANKKVIKMEERWTHVKYYIKGRYI